MKKYFDSTLNMMDSMIKWEKRLFDSPELGFKEVQTRKIIESFLSEHKISITNDYGINGFSVSIGQGKPHIGLIAELDALPIPSHFNASQVDGAAHGCGHHLQTTMMMHIMAILKQQQDQLNGKVTCFFVAAEEYVDLDYRKQLQKENKIQLLSGKQNLLLQQAFSDVDVLLSTHTMGEVKTPSMEVNASLSGFIYKKLIFHGKSSHAAVNPDQGVNALNALVLTQNGIALLRETFKESDQIRVHLITTLGGQSVNAVPEKAILEGYVRAVKTDILLEVSDNIDHLAYHMALAIKASVTVENSVGYIPFKQHRPLNDVLLPYIKEVVKQENIVDHQKSFAAGDVGDCSLFYPTIQLGFSGCVGRVHGNDFKMSNAQEALFNPTYVVLCGIDELLHNPTTLEKVTSNFSPSMTLNEYRKLHHIEVI